MKFPSTFKFPITLVGVGMDIFVRVGMDIFVVVGMDFLWNHTFYLYLQNVHF